MTNMPSVMHHNFSNVPRAEIQRSQFDRSFAHKTTFDSSYLIPVLVDEALPGDTFNCKMNAMCRLATPLHPIMDNMYLTSFFFAVPVRLLWDNWQKMMGEQRNPGDSTDFVVPEMTSPVGGYAANTIYDYMGLPTVGQVDPAQSITHDSLHLRAYNLIYNEWFRDQNLQNSIPVDVDDGPDNPADYVLRRRGKRHDYFTSALPWPQKGPAVELPLTGNAPVLGIGGLGAPTGPTTAGVRISDGTTVSFGAGANTTYPSTSVGNYLVVNTKDVGGSRFPDIFADLSDVTAATVNALRQAIQVQVIYEIDARGGTRYTEIIRAHFGVVSPDARMQRPEYLGGGRSYINIHPVVQNSSAVDGSPQGNLAAFGTAHLKGNEHSFSKSFTEHCVVIGLVCITADLTYQQGLHRMWSRQTRFDFYWPKLDNIGEQAVLSKEIYADGTAADEDVFGYQERYAEYRYKPSLITGEFRSTFAQSLDTWHLSQDFASRPVLGSTFISEDVPLDRAIAVVDEPHMLFDGYFEYITARPMPVYSIPGGITRF